MTIAAHPCLTGIRVGVSVRFGVSESWVSVRVGVSVRARLRARVLDPDWARAYE